MENVWKSWMVSPRESDDYINGVLYFLDFAFSRAAEDGQILCPCNKCVNHFWRKRGEVFDHLICQGFIKGYQKWVFHGEEQTSMDLDCDAKEDEGETSDHDDIEGLLNDTFREVAQGFGCNEKDNVKKGPNDEAKKFYNLVEEANQDLYPGCTKFTTLSFTMRLYLLKCLYGWSNASFTALLELMREAIPDLRIPQSFNKAKTMVRDLGLDYKKIDACPNDCILYWKEHEEAASCPKCGTSRWKEYSQDNCELEETIRDHKVSAKILRYFPIIPRLQRLFMCSKTAMSMRWHDVERVRDGKLRHPADGQAWKDFDDLHQDFSTDGRNIRLALASDGFNPYRTLSISYSIWPVLLMVYNWPPWMCMKAENIMLSLLIPGPKSPGNSIDVYMQPLIEDLNVLWNSGVDTYDAATNETFRMRAALLWTISDFPAYAMLSGWSTKGKLACPSCNYGTSSSYLKHSRKMCYMSHRVFLPMDHKWRYDKRSFNGAQELRPSPPLLSGASIMEELQEFVNEFGKKEKTKSDACPWKKKSIFFQLPYWKHNTLRHNLDVMHIEKNVCDNTIGTLLDIPGKTKDHVNARFDLQEMGIRKNLHPKESKDHQKTVFARACFSLTAKEKSIFCGVLKGAKLPDGSASNISRCVQVKEKKISGYKSHDAHFMLHYLLQIAIKSTMQRAVAVALIRLCTFFRQLCQKVIQLSEVDYLEAHVIETLCLLEKIFPPSFFDIMVHLPVHLTNEVRLGGPVHLRWMYPIERRLCDLKSFVRNKSRPEGSIAEGYLVEESLTLYARYVQNNVDTRLNRTSRNCDGIDLSGVTPNLFSSSGHPIGSKKKGKLFSLSYSSLAQAHRYVLFNCAEVDKYIREHENILSNSSKRTKWSQAQSQSKDFIEWFEDRVRDVDDPEFLKHLSRGPNIVAKKYSGYITNGYKFHTKRRDARRKTQNSGVTLNSITQSFASSKDGNPKEALVTYYGVIREIIELDYYGQFKVVVFRCDWFEHEEDSYGLSCVYFNKLQYQDDPFVLADQVHQCFYVQDPFDENCHYAMKTISRDLFIVREQANSNDSQASYWSQTNDHVVNLELPINDDDIQLVREDMPETIIDKSLHLLDAGHFEASEDDSDFDDTHVDYMD